VRTVLLFSLLMSSPTPTRLLFLMKFSMRLRYFAANSGVGGLVLDGPAECDGLGGGHRSHLQKNDGGEEGGFDREIDSLHGIAGMLQFTRVALL